MRTETRPFAACWLRTTPVQPLSSGRDTRPQSQTVCAAGDGSAAGGGSKRGSSLPSNAKSASSTSYSVSLASSCSREHILYKPSIFWLLVRVGLRALFAAASAASISGRCARSASHALTLTPHARCRPTSASSGNEPTSDSPHRPMSSSSRSVQLRKCMLAERRSAASLCERSRLKSSSASSRTST